VIENFRELAEGARELRLQVNQGDLKVTIAPDVEPYLAWDAHGDEAPEVRREGDTLRIRQVESWYGRRMDVELRLPASPETLHAKTGNGDVELTGAVGAVRVDTGNGELKIADVRGELHAATGNGEVEVRRADGSLRVNTGNGKLSLREVAGEIHANTGHGDVSIELNGSTEMRVNSGIGDVEVRGRGSVRSARLNTGKGDLECSAILEPGKHTFNTGFGDITALLAGDARARVDLQTGFGDVVSDFALVRVGRSGPMGFGGSRMVGSIGEGDPEIELSAKTGKGDLRLRSSDGPRAGSGGHDRVAYKFKGKRDWRGLGVDLASTISAEVASAIASSLSGREHEGRTESSELPRVEVLHATSSSAASASAGESSTGSSPASPTQDRPSAPPPPPVDLSGAVRSSQTPTGPDAEDPTLAVLQAVARGEISPKEAEVLLTAPRRGGHTPAHDVGPV
jgi:hypothetical protein